MSILSICFSILVSVCACKCVHLGCVCGFRSPHVRLPAHCCGIGLGEESELRNEGCIQEEEEAGNER